jgi:hypothetical protein
LYIQVLVGLFPVCSVVHSTFLYAHSARMRLFMSPPLCSVAYAWIYSALLLVVGCQRHLMLCSVNVCLWSIHVLVLYCILLSFGILSFRTYSNNLCLCCSNLG